MKLKKLITRVAAMIMLLTFSSTTAFAGLNLGNDDGTNFKGGTSNNYCGVYTDGGLPLNDTEGLRVTVYNAQTNAKVFNTIDITGNANISAASAMQYFSDGNELISKTTWLSYVNSTYNSVSESDMARFNNAVMSRANSGSGYKSQYIPALAKIDIVSTNNKSNLSEIKGLLSDEFFLMNLCDLMGGGLTYKDISEGKYKIAFEPVAYFRYNGQNWAMSATECGLLNKYMKNYFTAAWNTTNNLRALLGPLTHSNLPRSAFLENRDLGISVYSPSTSDYYNGNANYNSDTCIIRCMGIGVLSGEEPPDYDIGGEGTTSAEYHTNINAYTSFTFVNDTEDNIVGSSQFSIYNADDETPKTREQLCEDNKYVIRRGANPIYDDEGNVVGASPYTIYGYTSDETEIAYQSADAKIKVFIENDSTREYHAPYKRVGTFKDGDFISSSGSNFTYSVTSKINGSTIASGNVSFSCPAGEEAMGWFRWRTPSAAQDIEITIKSSKSGVYLLDKNGSKCTTLVISAAISKVEEITPPDPQVSDTKPSWYKNYSLSSVEANIASYAPRDGNQTLEWYIWTYDWVQESLESGRAWYNLITDSPDYSNRNGPYYGADYEDKQLIFVKRWGVDNRYYASEKATKKTGSVYEGAVILSGDARKITYSVTLNAEMEITPSDKCYTATYFAANDLYTMKSGYGIQISVDSHISGDTEYCTGSQTANVLFPEFNYNRHSTALYNRLLEKVNGSFVFQKNKYSTYNDRVHFTPIWFPDRKNYTVYVEVFDVWCPAGQLSVRLTDQIYIKGNVYDDWHIAPVKP